MESSASDNRSLRSIGAGIGWGPGFGPEVVGNAGAGCGVGFNVGVTLVGVGIGFPANYLLTVPHNSFMLARKGSLDGLPTENSSIIEDDGWGANRSYISGTEQSRGASFSDFKINILNETIGDFPDVRSKLDSHAKHMTDCLHRVDEDYSIRIEVQRVTRQSLKGTTPFGIHVYLIFMIFFGFMKYLICWSSFCIFII